jgi:hypothetical protein
MNRALQGVDRGLLNENGQVWSVHNGEIAMLRCVTHCTSFEPAVVCCDLESRIVDRLPPANSIGVESHFVIVAGTQRLEVMTDCVGCQFAFHKILPVASFLSLGARFRLSIQQSSDRQVPERCRHSPPKNTFRQSELQAV